VVAAHFGTSPDQISAAQPLPARGLLAPGLVLIVPIPADPGLDSRALLPDSEVVNSACGRNFKTQAFVAQAAGELNAHAEVVNNQRLSGVEIVQKVAESESLNPRLLLAFIEYRSQWVLSRPAAPNRADPLGLNIPGTEGLYQELSVYAQLLNIGYYGWREGRLAELSFFDGGRARIAPALNAGTAGLQYLFARSLPQARWADALYGPEGFLAIFRQLFGDPLACARTLEPLFPAGLRPPALELPFAAGEAWALTGGLHEDWTTGTPAGALDFAPITGEPPCSVSRAWVLAPAAGVVTRAQDGLVQLALLDGAGRPTGWELVYLHIAAKERAAVGAQVKADDPIGHPSCEGGLASGTHLHLARLYQGEWIGAGDAFPLALGGWLALPGENPYQSRLVKGDRVVTSNIEGKQMSWITR
jgi:murein DD-endopeptidase MepM/ murein hydrolase activator NlpD